MKRVTTVLLVLFFFLGCEDKTKSACNSVKDPAPFFPKLVQLCSRDGNPPQIESNATNIIISKICNDQVQNVKKSIESMPELMICDESKSENNNQFILIAK